jgi:hypothetical protein
MKRSAPSANATDAVTSDHPEMANAIFALADIFVAHTILSS